MIRINPNRLGLHVFFTYLIKAFSKILIGTKYALFKFSLSIMIINLIVNFLIFFN